MRNYDIRAVKKHQFECLECRRWRGQPDVPRMADLPSSSLRIMDPAFFSTGMDCFGPMTVKVGRRTEKRWGIIFKCLTTKGIHMELLTSLSADSFLMSLRRFIARRGKPFEVLSDRGTNFLGGSAELKAAYGRMGPELKAELAPMQINFVFNPPAAPHFGGSWEREIRSVKSILRVVLGEHEVPEEVLATALIEIEAILNSKPLGYVSSDVADLDPITPNDLLLGRSDPALPQVIYPETEMLSRKRWRYSQILADQFWQRYVRTYLPSLQPRQKWLEERENIAIGDLVLATDPQLPRAHWPMGRVMKVMLNKNDKCVRAVEVQVGDRTYTRPVARIIKLPEIPAEATVVRVREEMKETKEKRKRYPRKK